MSYTELTLLMIIITLVSTIAGYILGQCRKVDDKICIERQSHIQETFCLQVNALTDSVEQLRKDIKSLR